MGKKKDYVEIVTKANAYDDPDPEVTKICPFSILGYFCMICSQELSNIYLHCIGCEAILEKDFNICVNCHKQGKYKKLCIIDHDNHNDSRFQHQGDIDELNKDCPECIPCTRCGYGYCKVCSCQCHTNFNLFFRFMNIDEEKKMLKDVTSVCDENIATKREGTKV